MSEIVASNGDSHIERALPVAAGQHLVHHQFTLIDGTLALERNHHLVGDAVAGHHHAAALDGLLVYGEHHAVGGEHLKVGIVAENPVLQDV